MKQLILAAAAAFAMAGAVSAKDAAIGTWQTEVDDGAFAYITIAPCGAAVCGIIARTFNADGEYQSENLGRQLVIDMVPTGAASYQGVLRVSPPYCELVPLPSELARARESARERERGGGGGGGGKRKRALPSSSFR